MMTWVAIIEYLALKILSSWILQWHIQKNLLDYCLEHVFKKLELEATVILWGWILYLSILSPRDNKCLILPQRKWAISFTYFAWHFFLVKDSHPSLEKCQLLYCSNLLKKKKKVKKVYHLLSLSWVNISIHRNYSGYIQEQFKTPVVI